MTALSDLLQAAIDAGTSVPDALARMERADVLVDRGQTYKAVKGQHAKRPSERVLKALSVGFGIPITEIRKAVGVQPGELGPYQPPAFADRLSRDQRRALDQLIRTIVEAAPVHPGEDDDAGDVMPLGERETGSTRRRRGARQESDRGQ